jgi:hypothetical protein
MGSSRLLDLIRRAEDRGCYVASSDDTPVARGVKHFDTNCQRDKGVRFGLMLDPSSIGDPDWRIVGPR